MYAAAVAPGTRPELNNWARRTPGPVPAPAQILLNFSLDLSPATDDLRRDFERSGRYLERFFTRDESNAGGQDMQITPYDFDRLRLNTRCDQIRLRLPIQYPGNF